MGNKPGPRQEPPSPIDAVDVLNDLVGDLVSGSNVWREYQRQYQGGKIAQPLMVGIQRMCVSHVLLACCKFAEFYKKFARIIPEEHRDKAKLLVAEIDARGIRNLRNSTIGHIWDNAKNRPLYASEVDSRIQQITGGDMNAFMDWVNVLTREEQPVSTVCGLAEAIRWSLVELHNIEPNHVMGR